MMDRHVRRLPLQLAMSSHALRTPPPLQPLVYWARLMREVLRRCRHRYSQVKIDSSHQTIDTGLESFNQIVSVVPAPGS
jgi:hypothetical protein